MDERFANENIPRLILSLSAPAIAAQIINALYNVVDRMYIGRIPVTGTMALTGVGLTFPIIMIISAFAALVGFGGAPLASIRMGAGKRAEAQRLLGNCFSMLVLLALVLTTLLLLFKTPLLRLFGASDDTLPYADSYLSVYLIGTISVQLALGLNQFISAQGFAKTAMATVCVGAALNIILEPILIFACDMGVRGAAIATVISQAVSAAWVVVFLSGSKSTLRLRKAFLRLDSKLLLPAVALGASPFVMQATESLLTVTFNVSLQRYGGDLAVGAMTILTSVSQMVQMPLLGLAQGAQPILSFNYGAGRPDRMKQSVRYTLIIACVFAFAVWGVVQLAPHAVAQMFNRNTELVDMTAWALRIYFAVGFTMAFQNTFQQCFVALGEAKISLFLALERKVILLIPLILILPQLMSDKLFAVFCAEPVADFLAAATTTTLFLFRFRHILRETEQKSQTRQE